MLDTLSGVIEVDPLNVQVRGAEVKLNAGFMDIVNLLELVVGALCVPRGTWGPNVARDILSEDAVVKVWEVFLAIH